VKIDLHVWFGMYIIYKRPAKGPGGYGATQCSVDQWQTDRVHFLNQPLHLCVSSLTWSARLYGSDASISPLGVHIVTHNRAYARERLITPHGWSRLAVRPRRVESFCLNSPGLRMRFLAFGGHASGASGVTRLDLGCLELSSPTQ